MSIFSDALAFGFSTLQAVAGEAAELEVAADGTTVNLSSVVFEELDATKHQLRSNHFTSNKLVYSVLVRRSDLPATFKAAKNDKITRVATGEVLLVQNPDGKPLASFSDASNPTFIRIVAVVS